MTSADIFPTTLRLIDPLTASDHSYLDPTSDECYFIGEYTARQGYDYSKINSLILNFKKPIDRADRREWPYKEKAIQQAANAFRKALIPRNTKFPTFVPIPPSKERNDPLYDDRLTQMLRAIQIRLSLDVRELIVQTESTTPSHARNVRPTPDEIKALYRIEERLTAPDPRFIALVDDVLTTGAHFRAARSVLSDRFPGKRIIGLFLARCARDARDPGNVDTL